MISDLIVWSSVALSLAFVAAWAVSPALRAWIEHPKHHFLAAAQDYDRETRSGAAAPTSTTP